MPRGKYPRQSAAVKAAVKAAIAKTASAPAVAPAAVAPAPPAAASAAPAPALDPLLVNEAVQTVAKATKAAAVAITNARRPNRFADHPKSRDIDTMPLDELRAYGLQIGMSRRDCTDLTEGRLRAGVRSHLAHYIDALTE